MSSHILIKQPQIIEDYTYCGVNIGNIIRRIIKYAPGDSIANLNAIYILDDSDDDCFASYTKDKAEIRLYVDNIVRWLPWILKKTYIVPYLFVGIAFGHELNHHVHRNNEFENTEINAEKNAMEYIYPSFGIFKPVVFIVKVVSVWMGRWLRR